MLIMVALRKRRPSPMTVDEFLRWDADDLTGRRWQLVDGEPVLMAPAADVHSRIQAELVRLLGNHLLASGRPCTVVDAPGIVPKVRANENFRIPDLGVTCAPPSGQVMVPDPGTADRNPVTGQRGQNPLEHLDVHDDPERSGDPGGAAARGWRSNCSAADPTATGRTRPRSSRCRISLNSPASALRSRSRISIAPRDCRANATVRRHVRLTGQLRCLLWCNATWRCP